ncbi:hypothetical protein C5S36_13455, partial [Candidatus Methanophagaceae archaeon]
MNPRIFVWVSVLILTILVSIAITSAAVTGLNITPAVVVEGETLSISGKASPHEEVWVETSFVFSIPVSEGKYYHNFSGIHFPKGDKNFAVTTKDVKDIRISLHPVFWQTVVYPLEGPKTATGGTSTISMSFPVTWYGITVDINGKKDVSVFGNAAASATSVNLTTDMALKVQTDSNGDFELDMSSEG